MLSSSLSGNSCGVQQLELCGTAFPAKPQTARVKVSAYHDQPTFARRIVVPCRARSAVEQHMHPLKLIAVRVAGKGQDALDAPEPFAVGRSHRLNPRQEPAVVELPAAQGQRRDIRPVMVMIPAAIMPALRAVNMRRLRGPVRAQPMQRRQHDIQILRISCATRKGASRLIAAMAAMASARVPLPHWSARVSRIASAKAI